MVSYQGGFFYTTNPYFISASPSLTCFFISIFSEKIYEKLREIQKENHIFVFIFHDNCLSLQT